MSNECRCGRPLRNSATVCEKCLWDLERVLGDIPELEEELDVTLTRQRGKGTEAGAPSATCSCKDDDDTCQHGLIPWEERASEATRNLRALLVSWVKLSAEENLTSRRLPEDTLPAMARYLLWVLPVLGRHDAGPDAVDEITDAVADCRRVIDRRPERWFAGPCDAETEEGECGADLYARSRRGKFACQDCGTEYDVEERREWLLKAATDSFANTLVTSREASERLSFIGMATPVGTIDKWHHREKLTAHGETVEGKKARLYLWEDVLNLATIAAVRESRRQADSDQTRALRAG